MPLLIDKNLSDEVEHHKTLLWVEGGLRQLEDHFTDEALPLDLWLLVLHPVLPFLQASVPLVVRRDASESAIGHQETGEAGRASGRGTREFDRRQAEELLRDVCHGMAPMEQWVGCS